MILEPKFGDDPLELSPRISLRTHCKYLVNPVDTRRRFNVYKTSVQRRNICLCLLGISKNLQWVLRKRKRIWLVNTKVRFARMSVWKLPSPAMAVMSTGDLNANRGPNSDDFVFTQLYSRFKLTNFVKFRGKYLCQ